ncbi:MAG: BolA family protein [Henriciella sp.]|nr:BolA family protein [Henriciella sp.]
MSRRDRIFEVLTNTFQPSRLEVTDDSARHAGHAGASAEGETHYNVTIVSQQFDGLSRVAMQRQIMQALTAEFESGLHALSIKASSA